MSIAVAACARRAPTRAPAPPTATASLATAIAATALTASAPRLACAPPRCVRVVGSSVVPVYGSAAVGSGAGTTGVGGQAGTRSKFPGPPLSCPCPPPASLFHAPPLSSPAAAILHQRHPGRLRDGCGLRRQGLPHLWSEPEVQGIHRLRVQELQGRHLRAAGACARRGRSCVGCEGMLGTCAGRGSLHRSRGQPMGLPRARSAHAKPPLIAFLPLQPPTCNDGIQNGDETAVDCGGSCPHCMNKLTCGGVDSNCKSGFCRPGDCVSSSCKSSVCASKVSQQATAHGPGVHRLRCQIHALAAKVGQSRCAACPALRRLVPGCCRPNAGNLLHRRAAGWLRD